MDGLMIVVLAVTIPLVLLPVAFVWFLNIGGIAIAVREKRTATKAAKITG